MFNEEDKQVFSLLKGAGITEKVAKLTVYEGVSPLMHEPVTVRVWDHGPQNTISAVRYRVEVSAHGKRSSGAGTSLKGIINSLT